MSSRRWAGRESDETDAEVRGPARGEDDETVDERVATADAKTVPKPKAQRNFTDPASKIVKTSDGSFHQSSNAEAVVDTDHQIIVATDVSGHTIYGRRTVIVEPVFGQMHTRQNAKHLLLRGLESAKGEWLLLATCHNLRKLHNHIGIRDRPENRYRPRPSVPDPRS